MLVPYLLVFVSLVASLLIFSSPGFLEIDSDLFHGGRDFDISMDFRTDQFNALLLFTHNTHTEDYLLVRSIKITACMASLARHFNDCVCKPQVELEAGLLHVSLTADGHLTELSTWVGLSYCDGDWKQLLLSKRGSLVSAAVDDWAEETKAKGGATWLRVDSPLYLGGVPAGLQHLALEGRSHRHGETEQVEITIFFYSPKTNQTCLVRKAAENVHPRSSLSLFLSLSLPQASAAASGVFPLKVMKQAPLLVRAWISFWPRGAPSGSTWTAVPPARAATTAEGTTRCWCTAGSGRERQIIVCSLSPVTTTSMRKCTRKSLRIHLSATLQTLGVVNEMDLLSLFASKYIFFLREKICSCWGFLIKQ